MVEDGMGWRDEATFGLWGIAKSEFLLPLLSLPDAETLPRSSLFKRAADVLYDHSRAPATSLLSRREMCLTSRHHPMLLAISTLSLSLSLFLFPT